MALTKSHKTPKLLFHGVFSHLFFSFSCFGKTLCTITLFLSRGLSGTVGHSEIDRENSIHSSVNSYDACSLLGTLFNNNSTSTRSGKQTHIKEV